MRGWLKGWLGLGMAARSSRGAAHVPSGGHARRARSRCGHRTQFARAMAPSPAARWWLAGDKVLSVSSRRPQGGRRGRRGLAGSLRTTVDGEATHAASGGGRLGLLQYRRKKARVRRSSIGARSRVGTGRTEEGKTGSDGGPRNGEERRRCGR
jgi:hypothetical protein